VQHPHATADGGSEKNPAGSSRERNAYRPQGGSTTVTVAEERIERLHELAREAAADGEDERARRYVARARRIAERNRLELPRRLRRFTCDRCGAYLRPGRNARVRLQDGHVVLTCDCGEHARYPYRSH
jgi:ribonuclease P protein subunit RPR2